MAEPTKRERERARAWAAARYDANDPDMPAFADTYAQALADERARNVARLRRAAEGWRGRGMDGIAYAIEGEARELEAE